MITMGIDLGIRKAAFSVWHDDVLVETAAYESTQSYEYGWLNDVSDWVGDALYRVHPDLVIVEEPLIGNNRKYSLSLAKMYGAVMSELGSELLAGLSDKDTFTVLGANVKQWKKEVVGNGNATKDMVRHYLNGQDSAYSVICGNDQDQYDAACIGLYGYIIAKRADALSVSNR